MRTFVLVVLLGVTSQLARADDRASCDGGDRNACARIGRLKRLGALKADRTRDVDALIAVCGKALDGAAGPDSFSQVADACALLFKLDLQRAWDALASVSVPRLDVLLATGYAESYCPDLATPVTGCIGKRAVNFSSQSAQQVRAALSALDTAALAKELGPDKATPLAAKFDAAWPKLFAK